MLKYVIGAWITKIKSGIMKIIIYSKMYSRINIITRPTTITLPPSSILSQMMMRVKQPTTILKTVIKEMVCAI